MKTLSHFSYLLFKINNIFFTKIKYLSKTIIYFLTYVSERNVFYNGNPSSHLLNIRRYRPKVQMTLIKV